MAAATTKQNSAAAIINKYISIGVMAHRLNKAKWQRRRKLMGNGKGGMAKKAKLEVNKREIIENVETRRQPGNISISIMAYRSLIARISIMAATLAAWRQCHHQLNKASLAIARRKRSNGLASICHQQKMA